MDEQLGALVEQAISTLESANQSLDRVAASSASEFASLRTELAAKRSAVDAAVWKKSELERRVEAREAEIDSLKTQLAEKRRGSADGAASSPDVEELLRNRQEDLARIDSALGEVQKLAERSSAGS